MIRIHGYNFENNKLLYIALTNIYGIGLTTAKHILNELNINLNRKVNTISSIEFNLIFKYIENKNYLIENALKRNISLNIKKLIDINSYRGQRHKKKLPVRGQRTKTNSRTSRRTNLFIK